MEPEIPKARALRDSLFAPVDIAWLVYFRVAFGSIMLWEVWRYLIQDGDAPDRVARYYMQPNFHFTYFGFDWVRPWEGDGMYYHFYLLGILCACIIVGFCYRLAATLFFLGFTYVFLLDRTQYLNHFYLICLISFLMIFVPAHRALSIDAWSNPKLKADQAPAWTLWLLRFQIGIAYFYGGIAKMGKDWLAGEPMRTWLADRADFPVIGQYFHEEWAVYFFVLGGLFLDLLVVPGLLWKRTRLFAFLSAIAFHLLNARLFSIGIFPWFMLCATIIFFPHDLPRRIWRRLCRRPATSVDEPPAAASSWTRSQKLTVTLLALYASFQLLMPLRHFLYPGNVDWTEEGHNFSWHMKLRSKDAEALFLVTDLTNGHVMEVYPQEYLNGRQASKMSTRPDMILQFAHYLAGEMRLQGYANVEIRAQVMCSLNGREPQLLIDPKVDLTQVKLSLAHADWIVPLTQPLSNRALGRGHRQAVSD